MFVLIVFYLYEPEYTLLQVIATILMGFTHLCYLVSHRPYKIPYLNRLEIINESFFVIISYHLILFTDVNQDAALKV